MNSTYYYPHPETSLSTSVIHDVVIKNVDTFRKPTAHLKARNEKNSSGKFGVVGKN